MKDLGEVYKELFGVEEGEKINMWGRTWTIFSVVIVLLGLLLLLLLGSGPGSTGENGALPSGDTTQIAE